MKNQINIEELSKLAEQGDVTVVRQLADYYFDEENYEKALELYLKLEDQNDAEVLRRIGFCYNVLDGGSKIFEYFLKSAQLGNARAQRSVGICYENGNGVEQSNEKAVEWYKKAMESGDVASITCLGYCYEEGTGVEQSYEKANELYLKAAEQGNARAQCNLGYNIENGIGAKKSEKKASEWYAKAAEQGYARGQYNLAVSYYYGKGVKQNYDKAIEWFLKVAETGDSDSQNFLGCCYDLKNDLKKAFEYYKLAAEQDNRYAQNNMGNFYKEGKYVERDFEQAAYWYKKAVANGYEDAQNILDEWYEKGIIAKEDAPKVQDAEFGELVHYGNNLWKAQTTAMFNGTECKFMIELEGSEEDNVADSQHKAYAEYQTKKTNLYDAAVAKAKQVFGNDCEITPKNLFIDRQGNYGWLCNSSLSKNKIAFILSDGDVQFGSESVLYNYAEVLASRAKTNLKEGDNVYLSLFGEVEVKKRRLKGNVELEWVDEGKLELLVGDNYAVTETQKTAFIKFIANPEEYYNQVRECLFKQFLYDYEDFNSRVIIEETAGNHISQVTADSLRGYYRYSTLVIDAEGNLGFVFDCTWTESKEIAVLFTEDGLVALTPEMLRNVKKAKDPDFGLMLHGQYETRRIQVYRFGKVYTSITKEAGWIGLIPNEFSEKDPYMPVRLECEIDQQITPEQRAAYAEYLKNKDKHYADLQQLAKEVTEGTRGEGDVVIPKVLYIDRDGNYGWLVYVPWNEHQRGVMLSDGELFFTKPGVFHNYNTYLNFKAKTEFCLGDTIFFELCKELIGVNLSAGGDNAFDESGNYRTDNTLTEEEKDLLRWVLENRNLDHMADDLVEEANYRFNEWTEKDIEKIDLLEEMQLSTLRINIDDDGEPEYDVTISGNANWDGMAGVAITSSNREFDGVTGESYVL